MPVVQQTYDESVYMESGLTIEKIITEAIGLNNISTKGIIGYEIPLFDTGVCEVTEQNYSKFEVASKYNLDDKSIVRLSDEEFRDISNQSPVYNESLKKDLNLSKPQVLLHHTHSQEGYAEIGPEGNWNSFDTSLNIMGVGELLAKELEEGYGISVIHDKTIHDIDYSQCYDQSYKTVGKYLEEYDDFDLIIDLHRNSSTASMSSVNLNGENLARIMFVTAQNSPRYIANIELANQFRSIAENLFPSILSGMPILDRDSGIYGKNLGLSDSMILIEVGTNENSIEDAKRTTKYIARIIAEYLKDR